MTLKYDLKCSIYISEGGGDDFGDNFVGEKGGSDFDGPPRETIESNDDQQVPNYMVKP